MVTNDALSPASLQIEVVDRGPAAFWLTLSGEADIATLAQLEQALAGISLEGTQSVHLHLADLQFCDAASLAQLTTFAGQARRAGHDVMTCRASWPVHRVAHLLHNQYELGLL